MTRASSKVHKDSQLIGSFLRLAVNDPRRADKARKDLFNSIAKTDRILEALRKHVKTNATERLKEKRAILSILEAVKKELLKAQYRVSVSIQQRLRDIEIPVPGWAETEIAGKKRQRPTSSTALTSSKASMKAKTFHSE
ncbi:hypothetical protein PR003_g18893 [Phytophthora rubi]|uniref:Syntaxin N-terminal domain-containing protein n=1 Tax=Phytophthora rubi TaxID=129364 RepID=A0A6A3JZJ7_9STRA|nr:hypothetical protein PR002_g18922 [Phytophthora rubi]KAE9039367.1 hypothetical protein PR001_g7537 [Phytophthora rubi]KAE9315812.1 hypothetical protein PR003_g18893 [Phytophthora rubi]